MHGIWPICFAHFDATGRLDRRAMQHQVQVALRWGAPGVATLGLATEVQKLSTPEKRDVIDWTAQALEGAAPLAVTVSGATVQDQWDLAQAAVDAGARHLILQPPARTGAPVGEAELEVFFAEVLEGLARRCPEVPVGLQNAPEFLGVGLGPEALGRLRQRCANLRFLKGEASAVIIERTVHAVGADLPVLNGRGGLELLDNLRAGCAGMIVAPDSAWEQQRIAALFAAGALAEAEAAYAHILPGITFVMQSLDSLVVYGKRIAAWRSGLDVAHDRQCARNPTAFGLAAARRFTQHLGPLPGCTLHPAAR